MEVNMNEIANLMMEALEPAATPEPTERELAIKARQEQIREAKQIARSRQYECLICDKPVDYHTAYDLAHFNMDNGEIALPFLVEDKFRTPLLVDGKIMFHRDSCIVCSEACRQAWLIDYGRDNRTVKKWMKFACDIPSNIRLVNSLDELKNDIQDEQGRTFGWKLEKIQELLPGPKGFYLWGVPGNGKSTVAAFLATEYVLREKAVTWVGYSQLQNALDANRNYDELLTELMYQNVQVEEYTKKIRHGKAWDVVVLDDISNDFTQGSQQQRRLKALFMTWYENGTKLVITSNVDTETLGNAIGPAICSRLTEKVATFHFPDVDYRKHQ